VQICSQHIVDHFAVKFQNESTRKDLTAEEVKNPEWMNNLFNSKEKIYRRVYSKRQKSSNFLLKWISSLNEISGIEVEAIHSSFNIKHEDILRAILLFDEEMCCTCIVIM
jgi:serine/threonine protein phosphatase PrpC